MTTTAPSKADSVLKYALLLLVVVLYGVYYPWFMYHNVPSVEGMFHLNSQSPAEAWDTAVNGWRTANARFGEFCSYFLYGVPLHVALSIIHPVFMLLLAVGIQRLGTGKWPVFSTVSLLQFCYISFFVTLATPITDWWPDNLNWVYPCGVAMLFFALSEPLFRQERISAGRFIGLLLLAPVVGMGNEILVLTALPLFLAPAGWLLLSKRRCFTDAKYWILATVLLAGGVVFFSSPCWTARMDACGFSAGPLERLAPLLEPIRYFSLAGPMYGLVMGLTLAGYLICRKTAGAAKPEGQRLRILILVGVGYLLLTMVIPGYYPHREYRCLQFYGICVFAAMYGLCLLHHRGKVVGGVLTALAFGTACFYMATQTKDALVRCNLWQELQQVADARAMQDGILYLSEQEWDDLVERAHVIGGTRVSTIPEPERLILKTDTTPTAATLHSHKEAVTVYSVFTPEEQSHILLSSAVPAHLLHKCSADILLNRAFAEKVGLRGIVVVKKP